MESQRNVQGNAYILASIAPKFAPLGILTTLARPYDHDVALAVIACMLFRPAFAHPLPCGVIVFWGCAATECLQAWIHEPRGLKLPILGTFDWRDFVTHVTGAAVGLTLDVTTMKHVRIPEDA